VSKVIQSVASVEATCVSATVGIGKWLLSHYGWYACHF